MGNNWDMTRIWVRKTNKFRKKPSHVLEVCKKERGGMEFGRTDERVEGTEENALSEIEIVGTRVPTGIPNLENPFLCLTR